jgi:hypothetical protein
MSVVDPRPFLQEIDHEFLEKYKGETSKMITEIQYAEPTFPGPGSSEQKVPLNATAKAENQLSRDIPSLQLPLVKSRIVRLGEFIDTDAVSIVLRVFTH